MMPPIDKSMVRAIAIFSSYPASVVYSLSVYMLGVDAAILLWQLQAHGASWEVYQPLLVRLIACAEALYFRL